MSGPSYELPTSALSATGHVRPLYWLSRLLGGTVVAAVLALIFVPWQQSIRGAGRVIAYAPVERQQSVEAPIDGRVVEWFVQEGDVVKKGTPIADISDNDPEILTRLRREKDAAQAQVEAAELSIQLTEARIQSTEAARESAISSAQLKVQMAQERKVAAQRATEAAEANLRTTTANLERQKRLLEKELASQREWELAELDQQRAVAELERARASLRAAEAEIKGLSAEQAQVASSNRAGIESIQASLEKLKADKAKAEAELAKVEVRLARQEQMRVLAPRDGTIYRVLAREGTDMVKAGEALVLLVPDTASRAVEFYVDGNDAPLIETGRHVRLQFEGWPAIQFVGWPSVAVGTFGGQVAFVDAHGDTSGRFRVVVVPTKEEPWPESRYLRQGVRANGWALLNQVSLGFELWRQLNGFPPALLEKEEK